ncbi:low-specificity L-threonine aldolase [Abyssisolibacter fermentans]|uniref:low-specificity L-threonine aldolase n=1 Tax=Abyssisolibacter fermentans TaxID=1766203 RepID=UPI0008312E03|nr:low-specificity L-threonine aldolase [Abyssisolibacter fermentans]
MKIIDMRSDTVTTPTENMKRAMFEAIVGDDVYEDDPTVKELETLAANMVGKEAALFVPSGTFGNQLSVFTHTKRGDEVILHENSHIFVHEVGAAAVISNVQLRIMQGKNGLMYPSEVIKAIRGKDIHFPDTGLICLENAHSSGTVIPLENMIEIYNIAQERDIPVHLDGARVFNAATTMGIDVKEITKYCDSVMFCLSKGLCAPIGSMLAGSKEFIDKARKNRKLMGGGLRQVGILAAAGIIALKEMVPMLKDNHENAKYLADELSKIDGIFIHYDRIDINMVFFNLASSIIEEDRFVKELLDNNIKINGAENGEYRFVTHHYITKEDIDYVVSTIKKLIG